MSDENLKHFGEEIRLRRLAKGWDQYELASRVGSTATTVSRWENGKNIPQKAHYVIALKRELDFTNDDFLKAFGSQLSYSKRKNDRYHACSFATAAEKLGSLNMVDKALSEIMDKWPVPQAPDEYGADEKWFEILKLSPDSGGVIFHLNEIVGFWNCLAVYDEVYDRILCGENVNKNISYEDIIVLMSPGIYKLYFVDLFLLSLHNNIVTRKLLMNDFLEFMHDAAKEGIFFDRIVANVTGLEAKHQCLGLGFRKVIDHQVHRFYNQQGIEVPAEIFELIIGPDAKRLFAHDCKLEELYAAKGFFGPND